MVAPASDMTMDISTHALREEGDWWSVGDTKPVALFLPTPSARRATRPAHTRKKQQRFLPTPSARRATSSREVVLYYWRISTHALREEGDLPGMVGHGGLEEFLPTPSARRATFMGGKGVQYW